MTRRHRRRAYATRQADVAERARRRQEAYRAGEITEAQLREHQARDTAPEQRIRDQAPT